MTVGIRSSDNENVARLLEALNVVPAGETPLCTHIHDIARNIRKHERRLRAHNQLACIVIATDGESSDGDIVEALSALRDLPCWVIVRLCTNDERVVEYWNSIDERIDLKVDVLDDLVGEAKEVRKFNPWLAYGEALHRMREFGVSFPEMDALDEQLLRMDDLRKVCALM